MRGVPAKRAGGVSHFSSKSGKDPSDPAALAFTQSRRATSPVNRGGKFFTLCGKAASPTHF